MNFADRVNSVVVERRSQIVVGLDPDPAALLPAAAAEARGDSPAQLAATAVLHHCELLIEALAPVCAGVKFQLACFERLSAPGWAALEGAVAAARRAGLIALADAKRGDVPHTAAAYAQALLGHTPTPWGNVGGLGADAVTANPLLGRDSLEPIVSAARAGGAGVFVLVRTSNPGAAEIQDRSDAGPPLHDRLAELVDDLGAEGIGACGLADVGAVVGVTEPQLIAGLREKMPRAILLLPGVGAQGGDVSALAPVFSAGPAAGLVTAARSIVDPALESGDVVDARNAAQSLREQTWSVAGS
jgi:orotidine-5'-phosphate decarboxylase